MICWTFTGYCCQHQYRYAIYSFRSPSLGIPEMSLCSTGFFEEAKRDFQQVLKINPDFEEAKVSLLQTLQDQQHRMTRGYWPWWTSNTQWPGDTDHDGPVTHNDPGILTMMACLSLWFFFLILIYFEKLNYCQVNKSDYFNVLFCLSIT